MAARRPSYEVDRGERGREGAQIPEDVDERLPEAGLDVRDAVLGREGAHARRDGWLGIGLGLGLG